MSRSDTGTAPRLRGLAVADPPQAWQRLGFDVQQGGTMVGEVEIRLGAPGRGIVGWSVQGVDEMPELHGVRAEPINDAEGAAAAAAPRHPNGAIGIDHVVLISPTFDGTAHELEQAGMPLRRFTHSRQGVRQGFRRLGPTILELVETSQAGAPLLWGLTVVVEDLERLARRLGDDLGSIKEAVQPGRHIATLRPMAGLSTAMAFMDPATSP